MGGPTNDALADDAVAAISDAALNRTIMDEERNMVGAVHIMSNSPISTTMMLLTTFHTVGPRAACVVSGVGSPAKSPQKVSVSLGFRIFWQGSHPQRFSFLLDPEDQRRFSYLWVQKVFVSLKFASQRNQDQKQEQ